VTAPAACRLCRPAGFLVSALLHLGLAAALLWPEPPGMEGSDEGRLVGVSLAMFQTASEARAAEATTAPSADDQPESPPAEDLVEPETQPPQEEAEAPDAPPPEPEPEQAPEPTVAEEPAPTPEPGPTPETPPQKQTQTGVPEPPEPAPKPKPKPKPKPESKPKPRKPAPERAKRPPPAKAAASAEASAPKSSARSGKSAADGAGAGGGRDAAEGRYLAELQAAIAKHRFFPRQARRRGLEGRVTVSFTLEADGRIIGIRVVKGSGSSVLDEAAVKTLERLGRFKPIPKAIGRSRWTLRVPIGFTLR
jgi:protein TonB